MNMHSILAASFAAAVGLTISLSAPAHAQSKQATAKACEDQWAAMRSAKKTEGQKKRDFIKDCTAKAVTATPATPAPATPAPAPATKSKAATTPAATPPVTPAPAPATKSKAAVPTEKAKDGRQSMYARERACGAEWRTQKAEGKTPAGMTWPKYWSECNTRLKAKGM